MRNSQKGSKKTKKRIFLLFFFVKLLLISYFVSTFASQFGSIFFIVDWLKYEKGRIILFLFRSFADPFFFYRVLCSVPLCALFSRRVIYRRMPPPPGKNQIPSL